MVVVVPCTVKLPEISTPAPSMVIASVLVLLEITSKTNLPSGFALLTSLASAYTLAYKVSALVLASSLPTNLIDPRSSPFAGEALFLKRTKSGPAAAPASVEINLKFPS